jgi:hypothetical protein
MIRRELREPHPRYKRAAIAITVAGIAILLITITAETTTSNVLVVPVVVAVAPPEPERPRPPSGERSLVPAEPLRLEPTAVSTCLPEDMSEPRLVTTSNGLALCWESTTHERCLAIEPNGSTRSIAPPGPEITVRNGSVCNATDCRRLGPHLTAAVAARPHARRTATTSLNVLVLSSTAWSVAGDHQLDLKRAGWNQSFDFDDIVAVGNRLVGSWFTCGGGVPQCSYSRLLDADGNNLGRDFESGSAGALRDGRIAIFDADGYLRVLDGARGDTIARYEIVEPHNAGEIFSPMLTVDDSVEPPTAVVAWPVAHADYVLDWISLPHGGRPRSMRTIAIHSCRRP